MIDAEFRSEERYSRLSLAYSDKKEKETIDNCVKKIISNFKIKPDMYTTDIANARKVLIIEYHDDTNRDAGDIFDKIVKTLDIKVI